MYINTCTCTYPANSSLLSLLVKSCHVTDCILYPLNS